MNDKSQSLIEHSTLLLVDDTPQNIDILVETLSDQYELIVATDGQEALEAVDEQLPDLILLDIEMPVMNGFETCKRLKESARAKDVPVIFLTANSEIDKKTKGFRLGAVDYITKPFDVQEISARVETQLSVKTARDMLRNQKVFLEKMVEKRTREVLKTQDVTIRMAASLAETRDNETGNHIIRTQKYVKILSEEMARMPQYSRELTPGMIDLLVKSAPLHDVGKIGVPDAILLKQGKLDDEEFKEMKRHTLYGWGSLKRAEDTMDGDMKNDSFLRFAREIAYGHHEKWNGEGYPEGLMGEEIPLSCRIMAIADVYDALISERVYKKPFTHTKACSIIEQDGGSHFDPEIVSCFLRCKDQFRDVALTLMESEEEKKALMQ
ncbi:MAG: response regulator [Spirochaetales bacterium]|nr:response regulator [Spirochaetales bacterium]